MLEGEGLRVKREGLNVGVGGVRVKLEGLKETQCWSGSETGCRPIMAMFPSRLEYWFTAVSFAILIFMYDETRKRILRLYPGGNDNYYHCGKSSYIFIPHAQVGWKEKLITDPPT